MSASSLQSLLQVFQDATVSAEFIDKMTNEDHRNITTAWSGGENSAYVCFRVPEKYINELKIDKPKELKIEPVACAKCDDGLYRVVIVFRKKVKAGQTPVSDDEKKEE